MDNQPQQPRQPQSPYGQPSSPPPGPPTDPSLYPPTDPEPPVSATPPPMAPMAQKRGSKGKLIAILVAVLLVVMGGGSALAYKYWYQNPEKVVTDGLINAMAAETMQFKLAGDMRGTSPGTLTVTGALKKGAFSMDLGMKIKTNGTDVELKGSGMMDEKGDIYLKLSNLNSIVDNALGQNKAQLPAQMSSAIYGFVTKVNDKWVRINSDDLKTFSESMARQQTCMNDAFKKLRSDEAAKTELNDLYKKHKFISIGKELGSKDGNLGYELTSNNDQAKEFAKGMRETQVYKSLHDCDKNITIDDDDFTMSDTNDKVEVWVSRWSHEITKVVIDSKGGNTPGTVTIEPTFNEPVTITTPKDSMSVKELTQEIDDLQRAIMGAYSPAYTPMTTPTITEPSMLLN